MDRRLIELIDDHDRLADEHSRLDVKHDNLLAKYDNLLAKYDELAAKSGKLATQHSKLAGKHDELSAKHSDLNAKYNELAARVGDLEGQAKPYIITKRCHLSEIPPFGQLRLDTSSERHSVWMAALWGDVGYEKNTKKVAYSEVLIPEADITGLTGPCEPGEGVILKTKIRTELGEKSQKWWSLGVSNERTQLDRIPFSQAAARELLSALGPQYCALAPPLPPTSFRGESVERLRLKQHLLLLDI